MSSFITATDLPKSWSENRPIDILDPLQPVEPPVVRETSGGTMYEYLESGQLTLGQLVNAICCRLGTVLEDISVNKGNLLMVDTERLEALSEIVENVGANIRNRDDGKAVTYDTAITTEGSYCGQTYREFLTGTLGLAVDGEILPEELKTYKDLSKFYTGVKQQIDSLTTKSQQDLVNLQVCLSRRDVAYSTARSSVKTIGRVSTEIGQNM